MSPAPALLLFLVAGGFCGWVYFRREFTVRGRALLLAARLVTVAGVVAIIWNPAVPGISGGAAPARFVILDASASMAAATAAGSPLWDAAVERARTLAGEGARLLVAGGAAPERPDPAALDAVRPEGSRSVLADAVRVAAEAGAREITLVTDGRVADPVAVTTLARRLNVGLAVDSLPRAAPNLALARLVLPASVERGATVRGAVEVEGAGAADSVTVTVAVDGRVHAVLRLPPPGDGIATAGFSLGAAAALGPGARRVVARVEHADAFAPDDEQVAIVEIDPEETGVLLVSFSPDWEARFLLPVLGRVTGLPTRGFLRTGPDRYQPMDVSAVGGAGAIAGGALGRLLDRAGIVVAMGVDGAAAEFLERAAARAPALLLFPRDGAGAALAGVAAAGPLAGEWFPDELPPSPIAGEAGRFATGILPPLTDVLPLVDDRGASALRVRAGGEGEAETALLLLRDGRRRVAVAPARGFWRWASRDGAPREHYRRLWAAVAGWLMAGEPLAAGPGVRPAARVAPRGAPVRWRGVGHEGEEVGLAVIDSAGSAVLDSAVTVPAGGFFTTPPLPPGRYRYTVTPSDTTGGGFEVASFSGDMLHRALDPAELTVRAGAGAAAYEGGRPLRAWPPLYLVILAALCCEWVGRRRAGLR